MTKILGLFIFSFNCCACLIQASDFIYTYGQDKSIQIDSINCSKEELSLVKEVINESEGVLDSSILRRATGIEKLALSPDNLVIKNLEKIVHNRLNLPSNIKIETIDSNIPDGFFSFNNEQSLDITCTNCAKPGIQNLRLSKDSNGKKQTIWVKAKVLQATKAVLSKDRVMLDFTGINKTQFYEKTIYTTTPNNVVSSLKHIDFFRLNKTVSKNHILRTNDISAIELVKYGTPAKVILDNESLSMSTFANPLSAGKLGDTIKLKNLKSQKVIYGKITGKNEVKVEL